MPAVDRSAALSALLEPVVGEEGLVLERVDVTPAGRRSVVRVVVDLPDGPGSLDLDAVAAASRAVATVLDGPEGDAALGSAPYVLEVTSPGVERPLTQRRHWSRATGRLVEAVLTTGAVAGRLSTVDEHGVVLDDRRVVWEELAGVPGRVRVEFSRPAGPAGPEEPSEGDDEHHDEHDDEHHDEHDEQERGSGR